MNRITVGPVVIPSQYTQEFSFTAEELVTWVTFELNEDYAREQIELAKVLIDNAEARGGMVLRPGQTGSVHVNNISDKALNVSVIFTLEPIEHEPETESEGKIDVNAPTEPAPD